MAIEKVGKNGRKETETLYTIAGIENAGKTGAAVRNQFNLDALTSGDFNELIGKDKLTNEEKYLAMISFARLLGTK